MKAAVYINYGSPDLIKIKDRPKPKPKNNELLIQVHATTVNRTDCAALRGKPLLARLLTGLLKPKKQILGTDFAGVVKEVGKEVKSYEVGDRVFGLDDSGLLSQAEYMCISHDKALAKIPDSISFDQAAASLEGTHYALNFINKVQSLKDQKVLINGATGAIGSSAVQLSKYYGASITAVCDLKHFDLVTDLGADHCIDYKTKDFTKMNHKFHFVFDTVGKSSFLKCKPILRKNGIYISSELGYMSQNIFYALLKPVIGNKKVVFPMPVHTKKSVQLVKKLLEDGKFKPLIDRSYPFEKINQAYSFVEQGQKIGNVIINFSNQLS